MEQVRTIDLDVAKSVFSGAWRRRDRSAHHLAQVIPHPCLVDPDIQRSAYSWHIQEVHFAPGEGLFTSAFRTFAIALCSLSAVPADSRQASAQV